MSFWDIISDEWIRGNVDQSVSTYRFRTRRSWYHNGWYNEYLEFHDIIQGDKDDVREEYLLEKFYDIAHDVKQQWPNELVIEEYETIPEEQIYLEPRLSHYYYIKSIADASSRRNTKKFRRSQDHHRSSTVNDDATKSVYAKSEVLSRKYVDETNEQDYYPVEIVRCDDLIRIIAQTPIVYDKNDIKVKIYNDTSIEISVHDDTQQNKKKYYHIIEVPKNANIETAKCTYRNGILEITFKQSKGKRKSVTDDHTSS